MLLVELQSLKNTFKCVKQLSAYVLGQSQTSHCKMFVICTCFRCFKFLEGYGPLGLPFQPLPLRGIQWNNGKVHHWQKLLEILVCFMIYLRAGRMATDLENSMVVKKELLLLLNYPRPVFTKGRICFSGFHSKVSPYCSPIPEMSATAINYL